MSFQTMASDSSSDPELTWDSSSSDEDPRAWRRGRSPSYRGRGCAIEPFSPPRSHSASPPASPPASQPASPSANQPARPQVVPRGKGRGLLCLYSRPPSPVAPGSPRSSPQPRLPLPQPQLPPQLRLILQLPHPLLFSATARPSAELLARCPAARDAPRLQTTYRVLPIHPRSLALHSRTALVLYPAVRFRPAASSATCLRCISPLNSTTISRVPGRPNSGGPLLPPSPTGCCLRTQQWATCVITLILPGSCPEALCYTRRQFAMHMSWPPPKTSHPPSPSWELYPRINSPALMGHWRDLPPPLAATPTPLGCCKFIGLAPFTPSGIFPYY